jgi:hypothetical protein
MKRKDHIRSKSIGYNLKPNSIAMPVLYFKEKGIQFSE